MVWPFAPTRPLRQQQVRRRSTLPSRHPVLRTFAVHSRRPVRGRSIGPRTCGGASAWCTVPAGTVGGPSNQCSGKQPGQTGEVERLMSPVGAAQDGSGCSDSDMLFRRSTRLLHGRRRQWLLHRQHQHRWIVLRARLVGRVTSMHRYQHGRNSLVYCSTSNSRCGGPGARCKADDGSASGPTTVCQAGS